MNDDAGHAGTGEGALSTPGELVVGPPRETVENGQSVLTAPVRCGDVRTEVRVARTPAGPAAPRPGDALALWFVGEAMRRGIPLRVEADVSADLLENLAVAQEIFRDVAAYRGGRPVRVIPRRAAPPLAGLDPSRPAAAMFSGGLDGFYLAFKRRERIGKLLFIHGLDTEEPSPEYQSSASRCVQAGAAAVGRPLVEVHSNLRRVIVGELGGHWASTFPMAQYGVVHWMAGEISRALISADLSYLEFAQAHQLGSYTPLIGRWVSASAMQVMIDNMDLSRHRRAAWLAEHHPEALPHLWVCIARLTHGYQGGRNCGLCEKCVRTMAAFRMAGKLEEASVAFDHPLYLRRLAAVRLTHDGPNRLRILFFFSMLADLARTGRDPELQAALTELVVGSAGAWPRGPATPAFDPFPRAMASPAWPAYVRAHAERVAALALDGMPGEALQRALGIEDSLPARVLYRELLARDVRGVLRWPFAVLARIVRRRKP